MSKLSTADNEKTSRKIYTTALFLSDAVAYSLPPEFSNRWVYIAKLKRRFAILIKTFPCWVASDSHPGLVALKLRLISKAKQLVAIPGSNDYKTQRRLARQMRALEHGYLRLKDNLWVAETRKDLR